MSKIKLKHITIPVKTYNKFKRYAQIADIKMYQLADAAINEYLKNHPLPEEKQNEWIQDLIKNSIKRSEIMENIYLPGNNFIVNENIAIKYGRDFAYLLACLMSADKLFSHNGSGPWFYQTVAELEKHSGIKKKKQAEILRQMEDLGVIERKLMGMPAKRYFLIHYERAVELAASNEETEANSSVVSKRNNKEFQNETASSFEKRHNNIYNNNINNNIYKEKENIKEKENLRSLSENTLPISETSKNIETSKEKPTKKKPLKAEDKNKAIIEEVIAYLNERTGKHFTPKNKETVKFINGRLSEGYTVSDLKMVIDNRCEKWLNDEKMNEYLRPSTLFRPSNFEAYYNDVLSMKEKAVSEKEQEVIESFRGLLTPPSLPPKQALEQFKKDNNIVFMTESDFKKFEQWYKTKIDEWLKKLEEKRKKDMEVILNERAKNQTNVRTERYHRDFVKSRKF